MLLFILLLISSTSTNYKAVLVAGSKDWENYRHQADVFHAYTELVRNDISPKDIILFAYNDIAYNSLNPNPGNIINRPNGTNVFPGNESINFSGDDVTPKNFLNTLKNLSDPNLNLLIYFTDHGSVGLLCFPNEYLYVDQLKEVILSLKYNSLFFIVEACEAGSMFQDWFPTNTHALVLAATNYDKSSYACYNDEFLDTYIADCFSINLLEFLDTADTYIESIGLLSKVITNQTTTSPVTIYGDTRLFHTPLYKYWGKRVGGVSNSIKIKDKPVSSWDVPYYVGLKHKDIGIKDYNERLLYHWLKTYIPYNYSYKKIDTICIRTCINQLKHCGITLNGYSNLFIKDIATLCYLKTDFYVKTLMENICNSYN